MTRVQKERFDETEYKHMAAKFVLELATLEGAKPTMKILHPLPRSTRSRSPSTRPPRLLLPAGGERGLCPLLALVLNETV
jgi:aspartate carbamoyltransferase catalytic subunit